MEVYSFHGLYNPPTKKTIIVTDFFNNLMAWICKYRAKGTIIVSKFAGKFLISKGVNPNKLHVVYNGLKEVTDINQPVKLSTDCINIVFSGRLDKIKGLNFLLDAICEVKKNTIKKFHLYIIGDGPLLENLKQQTKDLNIEDCVDYVGYKNNIPSWLDACDIFVLPSLQENHSIALLEAMRAGKAIICTNVGGNPETVKNGSEAILIPPMDSISLKNELVKLLEYSELRKELGMKAKSKFLEKFTEKETEKKLTEVFIKIYEHKR